MKLSDISLSTLTRGDELKALYDGINDTARDYPSDKSIVDLFRQAVADNPGKIALRMDNAKLTYRELDERSNRIANWLLSRRVQHETIVAIYLDRSIEMIACILGILKAGGAYLPLNTDYPFERMRYIMEESKAKVVISEVNYLKQVNRLQWHSPWLESVLLVDSKDFYKETEVRNELMRKELWEYLGANAADDIAGGGWLSSYTSEKFSRAEMDEYAVNALEKIRPYLGKDKKVLEIGCASGITMYKVAPLVKEFHGTDLSQPIIDYNAKICREQGHDNIKLRCIEAEDIGLLGESGFDVIIINSVIQAFSGFNYLRRIIRTAIGLLNDKGMLFLGDVMDMDRKDDLLSDLHAYKKANPYAKTKLDFSDELFVPRAFFSDLRAEMPAVAAVHATTKLHTIKNELTEYRYDVVLEIDKSNTAPAAERNKYQFDARVLESFATTPCNVPVRPDQLSNLIFTSGSTGKPKGVMVEHRSQIRTVKNTNYIDIGPQDVVLQACEVSFDPSCLEIFGTLLNGATLCLISKKKLFNTTALSNYLIRHDVTIVQIVASLFHLHTDSDPSLFSGVRLLMLGGEVLLPSHIKKVRDFCPALRIMNCYGPTENTINTTTFEIDGDYDSIPIGKPVSNTGVYVMNKKLQLQPQGISGELCVFGEGLARGYLNDTALTAEKFIEDPLQPGRRMYRTGDLVRLRNDGNIEFLGRVDEQVKIKGHRVELKEIEKALLGIPQIKQAVILLSRQNILCAYITLNEDLDTEIIKQLLSIDLPFYMIPQYIVKLEHFPLNAHGKIDRIALPDPEKIIRADKDNYVAPGTPVEAKVAAIYEQVLGKEQISIKDDFFALGGHSLLATRMLTIIHKELNAKVRLEDIFEQPTIEKLAYLIQVSGKDAFRDIAPVAQQDDYELSHAQKRLWMLDQLEEMKLAYNMTDVYLFDGDVDRAALENAFRTLVDRHEILRTNFIVKGQDTRQVVHASMPLSIEYKDLSADASPETAARQLLLETAAIPFNLAEGPLFRLLLLKLNNRQHVFYMSIHHIISDGWSMDVLIRELAALYNAAVKGNSIGLPPLKIQYKDFAAWQNNQLSGGSFVAAAEFWKQQFSETVQPLQLPLDFDRPAVKTSDAEKLFFSLDKNLSQRIADISNKEAATVYMTVMALLNAALYRITGQHDIVLGSPVAGRDHASLHDQVGLYLNTLAVRTAISPAQSFTQLVQQVRNNMLAAFEHQHYPLDVLLTDLKAARDVSRNPLFDVGFTWQNIGDRNDNGKGYSFSGFEVAPFAWGHQKVKTDLWFHGWEEDGELYFSITYDKGLFRKATAEQFIDDFRSMTATLLEDAGANIASLVNDLRSAQAEQKKKAKSRSSLESFLKVKKKTVNPAERTLVKISVGNEAQGYPLVVKPGIDGLLLTGWLKENEAFIAEQLRKTGALLFRGFGIHSIDAFEEVSLALGKEQLPYMDQSSPRSLVSEKIYTSTDYPADQQINMHNELSYSRDWPMRIIFFCLKAPATGGETPIADSRKVLAHISQATKEKFAAKGIKYVRNLVGGLGLSWQDVYQTKDKAVAEEYCRRNEIDFEWINDNHLRISWVKPAIVDHPYTGEQIWFNHGFFFNAFNLPAEVRMGIDDPAHFPSDTFYGDGSPIAAEVIEELRSAFEQAKVYYPWEKGDVLLLDNMLMSHGRSSFTGERKVLVSMNTAHSTLVQKQ